VKKKLNILEIKLLNSREISFSKDWHLEETFEQKIASTKEHQQSS
jgi:hypothetical protein